MNLSAQQEAVVTSTAETVYVIAGPGSGKTHTLVARIKYRVGVIGTDPKRIAIMTFTNAAAREFAVRLAPLKLGYSGTLHGFCLRLLQTSGHLIGYRKGGVSITILPEKDRTDLVKASRDAIGLAKRISMAKVMEFKGAGRDEKTSHPEAADASLVWRAYSETLKRNNMVDYDRLLSEGLRLLRLDAVRSALRYDELYVDEAQDSGAIDWNCYLEFPAKSRCIVGDPDQSLYSWRGGDPAWLVNFSQNGTQHGGVAGVPHTVFLEQNYRSDAIICERANKLIARNVIRRDKRIIPISLLDGYFGDRRFESDADEIGFAFAQFQTSRRDGTHYSEMALLARTNAIAQKARVLIRGFGLPLSRPQTIVTPFGWQDALLRVALAVDPANDLYAEKIIGAGAAAMKQQAAIVKKPLSVFAGMQFADRVEDVPRHLAMGGTPRESIAAVESIIGTLPDGATLADLLAAMHEPETFYVDEGERDGVTISTVHGAKGREFDVVVVAGLEEGTFPPNEANIEEERRILFVAMTRARHVLLLTWAGKRSGTSHWERRENLQPSRFLEEIL